MRVTVLSGSSQAFQCWRVNAECFARGCMQAGMHFSHIKIYTLQLLIISRFFYTDVTEPSVDALLILNTAERGLLRPSAPSRVCGCFPPSLVL